MKFTAEFAIHEITKTHDKKPPRNDSKYKTMEDTLSKSSNQHFHSMSTSKPTPPNSIPATLNSTKSNTSNLSPYLELLLEGSGVCGDSRVALHKPDWYDDEKFKRGQKLAVNYTFGVTFAHFLSLVIVFAFQSGLEPLIYTGKSDSPFRAFQRYLSTVLRVKSWSETDIWEEGSKGNTNLKIVRGMHESVRKGMSSGPPEETAKKVTCEGKPMWTTMHEEISKDFKTSCPMMKHPLEGPKHVYINQTDMALTQFAFVGLILLFPKMFGVHGVGEKDLDGFAHFWRTIGYLLGIEDRFNLCGGDLVTVKQRCQDVVDFWVKPCFHQVSRDWMHMTRCMAEGVSYYVKRGTEFEVIMMYLCHVLSIDTPRLEATLNFRQKCMYKMSLFIFVYLTRIPGVQMFLNWSINRAISRGENLPPDILGELQNRVYSYEESAD